jgi:hypothetical protein
MQHTQLGSSPPNLVLNMVEEHAQVRIPVYFYSVVRSYKAGAPHKFVIIEAV